MRLTAILITAALAAGSIWGQAAPAEAKPQPAAQEPYVAEVIHVKTLTGDAFNRLGNVLSVFKYTLGMDEALRTIVVYAPKDVVAQMKRVVADLDTPGSEAAIGRNIEMTLTLLRCSTKAATTKLPDDIEPVAKQLRAATQYKDVQVWDVIPLRLQEGKATTAEMQLPTGGGPTPAMFDIRIETDAATRKDRSWSVRFKGLRLNFRIPVWTQTYSAQQAKEVQTMNYQTVGFSTAGDFLEGQKTVLGKVSGTENDTAIFAVISLKVLE